MKIFSLENEYEQFLGLISWRVEIDELWNQEWNIEVTIKKCKKFFKINYGFSSKHLTIRENIKNIYLCKKFTLHKSMFDQGNYLITVKVTNHKNQVICKQEINLIVEKARNNISEKIKEYLLEAGTQWGFFGLIDASRYPYNLTNNDFKPWFEKDKDAIEQYIKSLDNNCLVSNDKLYNFINDGIVVFDGYINSKLIDQCNKEIDIAIKNKYVDYNYGSSERIENLHQLCPSIKTLFELPTIKNIASIIFGYNARPTQTLTFIFGSEQFVHQDTVHLTTFPAGFMIGVWIALQDIQVNSGELQYYPGSHKESNLYVNLLGAKKTSIDRSNFEKIFFSKWKEISNKYQAKSLLIKKGDFAIWHGNLLHGGSHRHNRNLERRSLVMHMYADEVIAYADSSGVITATAAP